MDASSHENVVCTSTEIEDNGAIAPASAPTLTLAREVTFDHFSFERPPIYGRVGGFALGRETTFGPLNFNQHVDGREGCSSRFTEPTFSGFNIREFVREHDISGGGNRLYQELEKIAFGRDHPRPTLPQQPPF